jgi:hypothetical protein
LPVGALAILVVVHKGFVVNGHAKRLRLAAHGGEWGEGVARVQHTQQMGRIHLANGIRQSQRLFKGGKGFAGQVERKVDEESRQASCVATADGRPVFEDRRRRGVMCVLAAWDDSRHPGGSRTLGYRQPPLRDYAAATYRQARPVVH